MRWKKDKTRPKDGDRRTRSGFLWKPKEIGGEVRWLEFARWRERYGIVRDKWVPGMWLRFHGRYTANPDPPWKPPVGKSPLPPPSGNEPIISVRKTAMGFEWHIQGLKSMNRKEA